MEKEHDLFLSILKALEAVGALNELLLIGGWCPLIYKEYFGNPIELSVKRTTDLDFLIINAARIKKDIDIPEILEELGFDEKISRSDGYVKYVHPDLEIEFLIAEKGRGSDKPYPVDKLHINAQGLRFLDMLQKSPIKVNFHSIKIIVPEPSEYVLHKFIISSRRKNELKRLKDIASAKELGEYLIQNSEHREKLKEVYLSLPERWKKNLDAIIKKNSPVIYQFIKPEALAAQKR